MTARRRPKRSSGFTTIAEAWSWCPAPEIRLPNRVSDSRILRRSWFRSAIQARVSFSSAWTLLRAPRRIFWPDRNGRRIESEHRAQPWTMAAWSYRQRQSRTYTVTSTAPARSTAAPTVRRCGARACVTASANAMASPVTSTAGPGRDPGPARTPPAYAPPPATSAPSTTRETNQANIR